MQRGPGRRRSSIAILVAFVLSMLSATPALAITPDEAFNTVWDTTDLAVFDQQADYSWFRGPQIIDQRTEEYHDSPGGVRNVRYYDKSRMEINDPNGDPNSIWYVTNGLLTVELVTGRMKLGNSPDEYVQRSPAQQLVAGDPTNNPGTPSYAEFDGLATTDGMDGRTPVRTGQEVDFLLTSDGGLTFTDSLGVRNAVYEEATGHNIPDVFWYWMNDPANGFRPDSGVDWLYVLGYPITDGYWIDATVGGEVKRVLVQLYERRVLTYTPDNAPPYDIEFGNIGRHYYDWRSDDGGVPDALYPLYSWNIDDWSPYSDDSTSFTPIDGEIRIRTNTGNPLYNWWNVDEGDYIVSVDVRLVDDGGTQDSTACLFARMAEDISENYTLCYYPDGFLYSGYEYFDDTGYHYVPLVEGDYGSHLRAANEWNTLTIVTLNDQIWFIVNGQVVGQVSHNGPTSGPPGMYVFSRDGSTVEYAFTNFNVYAVN